MPFVDIFALKGPIAEKSDIKSFFKMVMLLRMQEV